MTCGSATFPRFAMPACCPPIVISVCWWLSGGGRLYHAWLIGPVMTLPCQPKLLRRNACTQQHMLPPTLKRLLHSFCAAQLTAATASPPPRGWRGWGLRRPGCWACGFTAGTTSSCAWTLPTRSVCWTCRDAGWPHATTAWSSLSCRQAKALGGGMGTCAPWRGLRSTQRTHSTACFSLITGK